MEERVEAKIVNGNKLALIIVKDENFKMTIRFSQLQTEKIKKVLR